MPPKRARRKSKDHEVKIKSERDDLDKHADSTDIGIVQRIFSHPALKIKEIIERGSAATLAEFSAELSEDSDWLHAQKAKLKELLRRAGVPEKAIPKTPRRGLSFARFRETAEMYSSCSLVIEEQLADGLELEEEELTNETESNSQTSTSNDAVKYTHVVKGLEFKSQAEIQTKQDELNYVETESESSYEDAPNSIQGEAAMDVESAEPIQTTNKDAVGNDVENSLHTSETYVSANENAEGAIKAPNSVHVKVECVSPPTEDPQQYVVPCSAVGGTPLMSTTVKREVLSSKQEKAISRVTNALAQDSPKRVLRSASRTKTAVVANTVARQRNADEPVASMLKTQQKSIHTAATPRKEENRDVRAAAGASNIRLQRVAHQHVVMTPCKPEYRSAVQRVLEDQEIARVLSPKRATVTKQSCSKPVRTPRTTNTKQAAKLKPDLHKKEELATRVREEQCRERAERIRKEREEKAMRAQRRREQRDAEEKLKAEELKKKEERDERRREEIRQKSPARSKAPSRVVSPARVPKLVANSQPRSASKVLFPSTPGRVPAKIARVVAASGETSREPTMNTPSRESRRKPFPSRMTRLDADSPINGGLSMFSPVQGATHVRDDEERKNLQNLEEGSGERCSEEIGRRMRLNGQDFHYAENVKMEFEEVFTLEEEQQFSSRGDEQGDHMKEEERRELVEDEKERELQNAFMREQQRREQLKAEYKRKEERRLEEERKEEERRLEEERKRLVMEEQRRLMKEQQKRLMEEQQRRMMEEQRLRDEAEKEKKERQLAEEEEAKRRLNVTSCADLHNRHLDNVSFNTSNAHDKSSTHNNSYEMTPDKKYKPATENDYNIEDLSSGDETDQEDAPRKKVPSWAEGLQFRRALEAMSRKLRGGEFDPNDYFGEIMAPDLALIFGSTKRYPRRGSSGIWESPISKPRQGVGAYQLRINNKY